MQNPLLEAFDQAPFSKIKTEHYKEAFEKAIEIARAEIDAIAHSKSEPTFENTIVALDRSGAQLDRISSIFFNLNSAETSTEIQEIAQEISPWLSAFKNDIILHQPLFERVKAVVDQNLELDAESQMLLEKQYKSFTRNGALLDLEKQKELRAIDEQLSKLSLEFGQHVLADSNAYELLIENEEDLEGLPEGFIEMAKAAADEKELNGWLITLSYPSYVPFMKFSKKRALREKLYRAFSARGFQDNENNNTKIIQSIVKLRYDRAQLLGYESHAHYILEERMAESPKKVFEFLEQLSIKAKPAAEREFKSLSEYAAKDGIDQLQKWDAAYYSEKLKKEKFELDDEVLKPYFELDRVIDGVFKVAQKLYGLEFKANNQVEVYHPEVKTYDVIDDHGKEVALFYADFHPRAGKRDGAWMTSYKSQYKTKSENIRPHVSIVCNFTKPTASKPSLLTFNEVTTLFHEFGHALHGMLANTQYKSLSGTSVSWDFVELPSQILENWCYEKEALELFAKHYQSDELIPLTLVKKIKEASNFMEGLATMRQLSFGLLDMKWHSTNPNELPTSIEEVEASVFELTDLYPQVDKSCMSTAFSHIFQGGYSAGYYSYKWAEVLDADAFAFFKEKGIFDKEVASLFKEQILSKGGTAKPMELYRNFRGKEPSIEALLKRSGLL
ncbi:MAG: M3 family metallopeptidase [Flavobacteriaceae bacterium]|jgi:peptidyl-dipeptidase Dcp|nr:M3 family metallopeptidase [Flavobacteriaceae bacterium]